MGVKRHYDDGCAGAHALNLVGERWAILVLRELVLGPKRFTDLRASLPGISPNVLSQRVDELEAAAIVRKRRLPPPAAAWVYELTEWGSEFETVIVELGRWGARSPALPRDAELSMDSLVLSFRTMFDFTASQGLVATYELHVDGNVIRARVDDDGLSIERGAAERPDATLTADTATFAAVAYDGRELKEAVASGDLVIEGDNEAGARFLTLFTLPEPAPAAEALNERESTAQVSGRSSAA